MVNKTKEFPELSLEKKYWLEYYATDATFCYTG